MKLVIGVGNLILKDEGVGVHVVKKLENLNLPGDVKVIDGGTETIELLAEIQEAKKIIFVDALKAGGKPGTIYRITPDDLMNESDRHLSLHEVNLLDVLGMAKQLGGHGKVVVIGIEPKEITWGTELSPEIEKKIPAIIEAVLSEINDDLE
jgi:hydrogenase maturation protease